MRIEHKRGEGVESTAIEKAKPTAVSLAVESVRAMEQQIKSALPRHIDAGRFVRVISTALRATPALANCDRLSLITAVLQSAQWGLMPNDGMGRAYLIPFGKTVNLMPGYRGLLDLARRSGEILSISAEVVREGDTFDLCLGDHPEIVHKPQLRGVAGKAWLFYAVANLKGGGVQRAVMTLPEIEEVRARSKASRSGPWVTDFNEMAKKTVLKRLCKLLPASPDLERAVSIDEANEREEPPTYDLEVIEAVSTEDSESSPTPKPTPSGNGRATTPTSRMDDDIAAAMAIADGKA